MKFTHRLNLIFLNIGEFYNFSHEIIWKFFSELKPFIVVTKHQIFDFFLGCLAIDRTLVSNE